MRAALALALLPAVAWAGWTAGPQLSGVPQDIQAYDGGYFVVTIADGGAGTAAGAYGYSWSDGGYAALDPVLGDVAGGALVTPTCVMALTLSAGNIGFGTACARSGYTLAFPTLKGPGLRMRGSRIGQTFLAIRDNTSSYYVEGAADGGPWNSFNSSFIAPTSSSAPLAALQWAGNDWVVWQYSTLSGLNYFDGGSMGTASAIAALPSGARALALYDNSGASLGLMVIDGTGANLMRTPDAKATAATTVATGSGFTSVDFTTALGSGLGRGFGLLCDVNALWGPIPDPFDAGGAWVTRGGPAGLVRVSCADPTFCVGVDSTALVHVYENLAPPVLSPAAGATLDLTVDAGTTLSVTDSDGDPLFISWSIDGGALPGFALGANGATASFTTPACPGSTPAAIQASDGYAGHDLDLSTQIIWHRPPLTLSNGTPIELRAGGPGAQISLDPGAVTNCPGETFTWTSDGGLLPPGVTGTSIFVTPPAAECSPTGTTYHLTLSAPDVNTTLTTDVPVTVYPWGPPLDPVFSPAVVMQPAGTSVFYDAGLPHLCGAAAGTTVAGLVVVNPLGGAAIVDAGPDGVFVSVADSCVDSADAGPIQVSFRRSVASPALGNLPAVTQDSDAGSLTISVQGDRPPLDGGLGFDLDAGYDAGSSVVFGDVSNLTGASCPGLRNFYADVTVSALDSGVVVADAGPFTAPGPFSLGVPATCAGDFLVTAIVTDDVAGSVPSARTVPVTLASSTPPVVGALTGSVQLACTGGSGTAQIDASGGCAAQTYDWSTDSGVLTIDAGLTGGAAQLLVTAGQLDALAGAQLPLGVTVHNGPNSATGGGRVLVTPLPFVEVSHRKDPVQPSEEEPSGVEVLLHNTTDCPVTGIGLRETLDGLAPVKGSVRLEGRAVPATVAGGVLSVDGIALDARQTAHLTYLARVPLLAHATPVGAAVMVRDNPGVACSLTSDNRCQYPVSLGPSVSPAPRACGCDAAPDTWVLLLALVGVLLRRRSR